MSIQQLPSRARSCILAGAIGDAWRGASGAAGVGQPPLFPESPRLSDDTWLTLATCEAVARDGGRAQPERIAAVFREWFERTRLHARGSSTLKALRDLSAGAHWSMTGARGDSAASAGAAMRAAALAFFLDPHRDDDRLLVRDIARITHHQEDAYAGALAMVIAIRRCLEGDIVPADLLALVAVGLPDTVLRDRVMELQRFRGEPGDAAERFGASGDVTDAVPLALFIAVRHSGGDLEAALDEASSVGGGTGAIASMTGQILGAAGCEISGRLLAALPERAEVEAIIEPFAQLVSGSIV